MGTILLFICIILVASILQTSSGFGFSIMATPFLLMLFQPQESIQINIILSLVISALLISKIRKDVDFELLKRLIIGSLAGIPFGVLLFVSINIDIFKLAIGILLLLLTALLIASVKLTASPRKDMIVGSLSGLLTTSIGMPGPPLLLYFAGTTTEKDKLRATTLAFYLFIYFVSLITQILSSGTTKIVWISSLWALPVVFIGLYVGQIVFKLFTQRVFLLLAYILLSCTGLFLLIEGLIR